MHCALYAVTFGSTSDSQTHGETHFQQSLFLFPFVRMLGETQDKPVPKSAAVQRQLKRRSETKSKRGKEKKNTQMCLCPAVRSFPLSCYVQKSSSEKKTKQSERIAAGVAELLALFWCRGLVGWRRRPRGCRCSLFKKPPEFGAKPGQARPSQARLG